MIETDGYNWLDMILVLVFSASVVGGVIEGFVRTVFGFLTSVVAVLASAWFYGSVAAYLKPYVAPPAVANMAGFILIFSAVTIAGYMLITFMKKALKWFGLGFFDRLFGGLLGAVRAAIAAAVIVMGICAFWGGLPPAVAQSRFAPYAMEVANVLKSMAPRQLGHDFDESYRKAKEFWREMIKKVPTRA
jgi:membrane protein required for colicin V production